MRRIILLVAVAGLAVGLGVLLWADRTPAALGNPSLPPVVSAETTDAPLPINNIGQHLTRSTEAAAVNESAAVTSAQTWAGPSFGTQATSIVVGKYRFSDDGLATSIVPKNALVWIVSVNCAAFPASYGTTAGSTDGKVAHQLNYVVDASTGECLLAYAGSLSTPTAAELAAIQAATGSK